MGSAPACYGSSLGSNPDISLKYEMGNKAKEWPTHSSPPRKYTKKSNSHFTRTNTKIYSLLDYKSLPCRP